MELQTAARYRLLDELRGLDLISMMLYHGMWDVVFLFGVAQKWYTGRPGFVWQQSICWVFILLSGFCLPLGHRPLRRGLIVSGAGVLVTAVTLLFMPEDRVVFGVLTLLGAAMLITGLLQPLLQKIPAWAGLVVSLLLAILINKKAGRLTKGYRVALFLPSITSTVAVSMVWLWIFNPDMGILNNILTAIGLNDVPLWLGDPAWSKPALVIMRVWQMSGYYMLMFLAGLQTIPETLYEAADVDGATGWQKFIRITVPMLSNTTFVVAILLVIEAFNMFESIFVMTKGGPLGSTSTIMYYIYEQGFTNYNMGYASALAWIFFALIMIVTLVQYRFRHEQGGE